MWLVKVYEVLPKAVYYLGDDEWTCQRDAKRFTSKQEARAAAREHDNAVVVHLVSKPGGVTEVGASRTSRGRRGSHRDDQPTHRGPPAPIARARALRTARRCSASRPR